MLILFQIYICISGREGNARLHSKNDDKIFPINKPNISTIPHRTNEDRKNQDSFKLDPITTSQNLNVLAAITGASAEQLGFTPEVQALMQLQMKELLGTGVSKRSQDPSVAKDANVDNRRGGETINSAPPEYPMIGAINVEDLEASFHIEKECNDIPKQANAGNKCGNQQGSNRPPPGFGGEKQLEEILGQFGSNAGPINDPAPLGSFQQQNLPRHLPNIENIRHGVPPGGITAEQLRKGGILPEQLRAGGILPEQLQTGAIFPEQLRAGGILPEQLQAGGILPGQLRPPTMMHPMFSNYGIPPTLKQRQLSGDLLGIQSLANMVPVEGHDKGSPIPFSPMMLPMLPLGMPQMYPFGSPSTSRMNPIGVVQGPPPMFMQPLTKPEQQIDGVPQPEASTAPPLQAGWPSMFGPFTSESCIQPFPNKDTGFPSSVLLPGDLKHPLFNPATPPHEQYMDSKLHKLSSKDGSDPLPIHPNNITPDTPEVPLAEGSPMTPPNLNLHSFDFED